MPAYLDRYHIIGEMKGRYPIKWLTEMAKVERSGYYRWLKNGKISLRKCDNIPLKEHIIAIHQRHKMDGYPRMNRLSVKSFVYGEIDYHVYLIMCGSVILKNVEKMRVLVTDITYLPTKNGFLYMSAVQDLYNNEIVAWKIRCVPKHHPFGSGLPIHIG